MAETLFIVILACLIVEVFIQCSAQVAVSGYPLETLVSYF